MKTIGTGRKLRVATPDPEQSKAAPGIAPKQLVAALDQLFTTGGWEIPDQAVEGKLTAQVQQLKAQMESLTKRVAEIAGAAQGTTAATREFGGRVDAIAAARKKGKKR
jgi:hypothetical protein